MERQFSISLAKIIKVHSLEVIYTPKEPEDIYVTCSEVNRPGLLLSGYSGYFEPERLEIIGLSEMGYLKSLSDKERYKSLDKLFSQRPPAIMVTRKLEVFDDMMELAKKYEISILRTAESTSSYLSTLISYLNVELAPRITRHGVLVEVYGEGVLLLGESGVGKSETAIELVKRGHRLIADDAVEIRRVSSTTLVGTAPDNIRHFVELRGIGIVNVRRIFGVGAVKLTEKVDMVIQLEAWDSNKVYDRMGLDIEYMELLGIQVPMTVIPVKPGRNLAIILEVAAMNNRQKKMGYNAARELLQKLGMEPPPGADTQEDIEIWQH